MQLPVLVTYFLGALVSLVTIINPPSAIPLFNALSSDLSEDDTEALARRASRYAFLILTGSLFAGSLVMNAFGVSYGALRISGGIVVALLGHGMLFGSRRARPSEAAGGGNPAFFPLALPGISGPGSIAVVIGLSTEIQELETTTAAAAAYVAVVIAIAASAALTWLVLHSARRIGRTLGANGIEAMTRLMGFLLICIGVQFIASGIRTFAAGT